MNKTEYLIETFKRTYGKNFENYIINAIWHKVDNMNLKPVTQQYVKRNSEKGVKYAKLDLYFPAINFAVEVNELYHNDSDQKKMDSLRSEDILSAIEMSENKIYKINCFLDGEKKPRDIDELNKDIDACVTKIKKLTKDKKLYWNIQEEFKEKVEELKEKGSISAEDNLFIPFKTFEPVYNIMKEVSGWNKEFQFTNQKRPSSFQEKVDKLEKYDIWFIKHRHVEGAHEKYKPSWDNIIAKNFETIEEVRNKGKQKYGESYSRPRIVFILTKNNLNQVGYIFKGVYQPQLDSKAEAEQKIEFKRISETYSWK